MSLLKALFSHISIWHNDTALTRRSALRVMSDLATARDDSLLETTELDLRPIENAIGLGAWKAREFANPQVFDEDTVEVVPNGTGALTLSPANTTNQKRAVVQKLLRIPPGSGYSSIKFAPAYGQKAGVTADFDPAYGYSLLIMRTVIGNDVSYFVITKAQSLWNSINPLLALPQPNAVMRFINARLQQDTLPTVNDFSYTAVDMTSSGGLSQVGQTFDFANSTTASIPTGYTLPVGTQSFTFIVFVARKAGYSWDSGTNRNLLSGTTTGATLLMSGGNLKYHHGNTLYDSGQSLLGWTAGAWHAVALVYDGVAGTLKSYIDDPITPKASHTGVPARTTGDQLRFGQFSVGNGSWGHLMNHGVIYSTALSAAELQQAFRAGAMHLQNIVFEGDSNVALFANDNAAPAGNSAIWYKMRDNEIPERSLATNMYLNNAFSGSMWNTIFGLAPSSLFSRQATLNAGIPANRFVSLVVQAGYNDIMQQLHSGNVTQYLTDAATYFAAAKASGKYWKVGAMHVPPTTNSTLNGRCNTYNAGLDSLKASGAIDFVVSRPPALSDPFSAFYFAGGSTMHWNDAGCAAMAVATTDALYQVSF